MIAEYQMATTTTVWGGWQTVNPKCHSCSHSIVRFGVLVCRMASRTIKHGPCGCTCMSYLGKAVEK